MSSSPNGQLPINDRLTHDCTKLSSAGGLARRVRATASEDACGADSVLGTSPRSVAAARVPPGPLDPSDYSRASAKLANFDHKCLSSHGLGKLQNAIGGSTNECAHTRCAARKKAFRKCLAHPACGRCGTPSWGYRRAALLNTDFEGWGPSPIFPPGALIKLGALNPANPCRVQTALQNCETWGRAPCCESDWSPCTEGTCDPTGAPHTP